MIDLKIIFNKLRQRFIIGYCVQIELLLLDFFDFIVYTQVDGNKLLPPVKLCWNELGQQHQIWNRNRVYAMLIAIPNDLNISVNALSVNAF